MKKKILTLFLISFLMILSCKHRIKPIGEDVLDFEKINFNTTVFELYPEKYKSQEYENTYIMKGFGNNKIFVTVDSSSIDGENNTITFLQGNTSSFDSIASFGSHIFQKINTISGYDGKIRLINAVSNWKSKTNADNFLKLLNEKYGKPTELINGWNNKLILYQWEEKDRIIRFVSSPNSNIDDFNKVEKLIYKNKFIPSNKEKQFDCYLFVLNSAYKKYFFEQKTFSGDFVYFRKD